MRKSLMRYEDENEKIEKSSVGYRKNAEYSKEN